MNTKTQIKDPKTALTQLIEGNRRFTSGLRSVEPMVAHLKMAELARDGQKPFAIILTCSDSRSPAEMIFDQGVGDLFVVRVAGNVIAPSLLASMEFAAANFGSCLIVVMGHTKCGAVNATYQHSLSPASPLPSVHLEELVSRIKPAVESTKTRFKNLSEKELVEKCTENNVARSCNLILEQSSIIRNLTLEGKLKIEGAILDIQTGTVNFIEQSQQINLKAI